MKFEDVVNRLDAAEVKYVVHEHEPVLTMDAVEQAQMFDMDSALKTMLFHAGDKLVAVLLLGSDKVSLGELARTCGVSRRQLQPVDAEDVPALFGDTPGGVGPVQEPHVWVIADTKVASMTTVSCGGGRPDRTLELDATELLQLCNATTAPIARVETI